MKIYINEISEKILKKFGINFNKIYNGDAGVHQEQLSIITKASNFFGDYVNKETGEITNLKENMYTTIKRLDSSKNKATINFANNIKNTMVGTINNLISAKIGSSLSNKQKGDIMIKWLPSTAEESDPIHSLYYGKTMSLDKALKKGLNKRWGCQCGFEVVDDDVINIINEFNKKLKGKM